MGGKSSLPEPEPEILSENIRVERLRHRPDFLHCARGIRRITATVTLETAPTPKKFATSARVRVGFTATRKSIGGAVARNRAKRRLRAAAQATLPLYGVPGNDYVLVARAGMLTRPFPDLLADLEGSLKAVREKVGCRDES